MNIDHMFDNAATASQNKSLIDDPITRGAILRSFVQWIDRNNDGDDVNYLKYLITIHEDYKR